MRLLILPALILLSACLPVTPVLPPAPTQTTAPRPEPTPTLSPGLTVDIHPDGPLFVGDQVSLVVYPSGTQQVDGREVLVQFRGQQIARGRFDSYGMGGRAQATFFWAWDTTGLDAGPHTLSFSLHPDGPAWQQTITLHPEADKPAPERDAHWETFTTNCCILHYITNTDAERDLAMLVENANTQSETVEELMRTDFSEKVTITYLPRTLGHGGFATDSIFVSYLDANYAGGQSELVVKHEMVHILDRQMGGKLRPSILVEGLATYLTGGHFKTEPIAPRAAALLDLGWYIPLRELSNNFYPSQHEIGYLQGAALVQYLVETYGWETFNNFYRNIEPGGAESEAMDIAMRLWLGVDFDTLEAGYIAFLRSQPRDAQHARDVALTVNYYDTVRRYQRLLDPSAYFMTAWLPDANAMRARGIIADYLRRPNSPVNHGLETMFLQADQALRSGQFDTSEEILKSINVMLDILENQ